MLKHILISMSVFALLGAPVCALAQDVPSTWGTVKTLYGRPAPSPERTMTFELELGLEAADEALTLILDHDGRVFDQVTVFRVGGVIAVDGRTVDGRAAYNVADGRVWSTIETRDGGTYLNGIRIADEELEFDDPTTMGTIQDYMRRVADELCDEIGAGVGILCMTKVPPGAGWAACALMGVMVGIYCDDLANLEQINIPWEEAGMTDYDPGTRTDKTNQKPIEWLTVPAYGR